MKQTLLFAAWGVLTVCGVLAQRSLEGASLPDFRASVRFHFRKKLADVQPNEKGVTAPAYRVEELPPAQLLPEKNRRVIQGNVRELPFTFNLRLTQPDTESPPLLEVNVVDPHTGRSLKGFPAKRPLTRQGVAFDLPLSEGEARQARRAFANDGSAILTYVNLVVNLAEDR